MTTDELRAAAEMVVATGMNKDWADTIDAGAVAVCRAWLAANPADDAEPLTVGWLASVGFEPEPDDASGLRLRLGTANHPTYLIVSADPGTEWDGGQVAFVAYDEGVTQGPEFSFVVASGEGRLRTRGDVRRLLAVLGVPT